ncbi:MULTISPECIES: GerAB/ArcD/ProY family transporter [Paenibacillus]|uniref:GerAB/ArcD/ProY family transporter n=1 Tax=Paenibacillus TaxID=44249 RepID=UPI0022B90BCC|nr:endospore germination permease [Paenibacillus caseinilyticus]MCZ8521914.1 endospore germination permease [Paenibacillus caseinilyticus]
MDKSVISTAQFQLLVILFTIGTTILITPAGLAAEAHQDAWIAAVIGVVMGMPAVWFVGFFGRRLGQKSFVEYCREVLGTWIGTAVCLFYIFFFFVSAASLISYVSNFLTTQILVETPVQFIHLLFAIIVVMALRLGLETIARTAEIFFPWFLLLFAGLALLLLPKIDIEKVQPLFEADLKSLLRSGITLMGISAFPLISFLMVIPSVKRPQTTGKAIVSANLTGGFFIIAISFLSIAVLGADLTERLMYPSYALAKKISVGKFIERVEIIIAALWFISIFFKLTLYLYASALSLSQLVRMKSYRPLVLPLGMLLVVYGQVVYPNVNYMAEWDKKVWEPLVLVVGLIIPVMLLAVERIRKAWGQ